MRIAWRTKWGLPGGYKCRATGALGEAGKSSLVSGGAEMWRNSISYHPALYIANCLFWKARKKNFQLFRALKPQPTSWVGWGTWLAWTMHTWGKLATEEPWKWNNMDTTFLIMTVFAYFSMKSNSIWNCNWKNWIKYNIQLNWFVLQCCSKGNIWDVEYRIYFIMGITTWTSHALTGWRGCTGIVLGINTW